MSSLIVRSLVVSSLLIGLYACTNLASEGMDHSGIELSSSLIAEPETGRLFIAFSPVDGEAGEADFSRTDDDQPRFQIGWPLARTEATPFFAVDVASWEGESISFEPSASYPMSAVHELPAGDWLVQALFDTNTTLSDLNSPGNRYSDAQLIEFDGDTFPDIQLELTNLIAPEALPEDTDLLRFVRIRSELLSEFYQRDIYLRASVLLPASSLDADLSALDFPVLFHIGGLNARYYRSQSLMADQEFSDYWMSEEAPQVAMVFLDGESPWGDSYQVNSEVSGPYADANFQELFPYLEGQFPIASQADARFLSGCSTGGWVSMALQVFYPDYFNGTYSFSPDSPSFSAFQLADLYQDENAFTNEYAVMRPSMRQTDGEPLFGIGDEIQAESAMGIGDNFLYSGQQWASWNIVYGSLDSEGNPVPVWDPATGEIDSAAVAQWAKWDIDKYLQENWSELGPKLEGKLNFWMGDMDNFYLNIGLRILEENIQQQSNPISDANFTWVPNAGHCALDNQTYYFDVLEKIVERVN